MTRRFCKVLALCSLQMATFGQPTEALDHLNRYLNAIGTEQTARRASDVAKIQTRAEAERRQTATRKKILDLIGGLPDHPNPVPARTFSTVKADGFHIEVIAYESALKFFVTALVFVPEGKGPFPAVIETPGHGAGKSSEYNWAANFAKAGIVALAVDPLGQGERMQHWDPEIGASKLERLADHEHASLSAQLIGDHISRYFINDGMRGIDYLTQRKDVDASRIGAWGCSGGGTITAYLAALDTRIKAAASACFITSFKELFPTQGPQDAEQTIPQFTAEGLDFADWVELAAPRPYAIVSTTNDMFPYAGAQQTYDEAKRFYGLFNATDQLQWITGPGGHGNLGPISQPILDFFTKNLKADTAAKFSPQRPADQEVLIATRTGQVTLSLGSRIAEDLNREHAKSLPKLAPNRDLAKEIRSTAGMVATSKDLPKVTVNKTEQRDGFRLETVTLAMEPGMDLGAILAIPNQPGPKPAIVMMDQLPMTTTAATPEVARLAKSGKIVVVLQPRGTPIDAQNGQSTQFALGPYMAVSLRAVIVGKTLVGMRADDAIRVVNWLTARPDVDRSAITLYGKGALGMAALHAAALDPLIARVVTENTLVSYRNALEAPMHRNLSEYAIPGILKHYDVNDLISLTKAKIAAANPVDAVGQQLRIAQGQTLLGDRVKVLRRGPRDPWPIE